MLYTICVYRTYARMVCTIRVYAYGTTILLISVPFEHSVHAVNYSVVVLKCGQPPEVVRIGTKVITRRHLCKGQQSIQLKVADSLLKPPRNNSRRGRNVRTELKSTVYAYGTAIHTICVHIATANIIMVMVNGMSMNDYTVSASMLL